MRLDHLLSRETWNHQKDPSAPVRAGPSGAVPSQHPASRVSWRHLESRIAFYEKNLDSNAQPRTNREAVMTGKDPLESLSLRLPLRVVASRSRIEHSIDLGIRSYGFPIGRRYSLTDTFFCCISISIATGLLTLRKHVPGGHAPSSEGKILRAHGGCLGIGSRRRARQAAISPGEAQTAFDPGVPEWGNPPGAMPRHPRPNA